MRLSRAALLPEVEEQATLPELLQHVDPEAGAAELDLAADTAQSASSQLAARQGEALECVTQELLANPDILRCAQHIEYCAYSVALRIVSDLRNTINILRTVGVDGVTLLTSHL